MMTSAQREQLLRHVVFGVELDIAMEALGISGLDLRMRLLCDETFDISLALAQGMRTESAKALCRALVSN
jgi:hypothetical protein